MNGSSSTPATVEYKDRRLGLIVFGILELAVGALCAAMVPLSLLVLAVVPDSMDALNGREIATVVTLYGAMALMLVWLGIGSILCRRWARTLLVILSWSWLLAGVLAMGFLAFFAHADSARAVAGPVLWLAMAIAGIFCVVLPGAIALFYQSRHVKATCEARDPLVRWTDRCPLTVLTTSVWLGLGALWLLAQPLTYGSVVPMFGYLLTGTPATLTLLGCAAFGLCLTWGTYRLKVAAWWATLAAFGLFSASTAITFTNIDPVELYRQLGYSEEQIDQLRNLGLFTGKVMAWWTVAFFLLFVIYLVWIKKYFRRANAGG